MVFAGGGGRGGEMMVGVKEGKKEAEGIVSVSRWRWRRKRRNTGAC